MKRNYILLFQAIRPEQNVRNLSFFQATPPRKSSFFGFVIKVNLHPLKFWHVLKSWIFSHFGPHWIGTERVKSLLCRTNVQGDLPPISSIYLKRSLRELRISRENVKIVATIVTVQLCIGNRNDNGSKVWFEISFYPKVSNPIECILYFGVKICRGFEDNSRIGN